VKIILAIDGSACSDVAIEVVAGRRLPAGSEVRVISVLEPVAPLTSGPWGNSIKFFEEVEIAEHQRASLQVERAVKKFFPEGKQSEGLKITTDILKGSPKRVLVEEAEAWGADLIVLGSHGYRSWERMLLGSVSKVVSMRAKCAVEIIRRPESQTA
jgi:nucleotide-binding universal stress UspA family protein